MHEDLQQFPVAAKVLPYSEYTVKLLHNLIKAKTCTQQDNRFHTWAPLLPHTAASAAAQHTETKITRTFAHSPPIREKSKKDKICLSERITACWHLS